MTDDIYYFFIKDEEIADEENLLAPLDVYLYFETVNEIIEAGNYHFGGEYFQEMAKPYDIEWGRVRRAIIRLSHKQLLTHTYQGPLPKDFGIDVLQSGLSHMGIYSTPQNMRPEELQDLRERKMYEALQRIDDAGKRRTFLETLNKKTKEIEDSIEELRKSQRENLRNMVSIFGVFVAIFSFIIIGMNTALRIEFTGDIVLLLKQVVVIISPIIVGLIILLYFVRRIFE